MNEGIDAVTKSAVMLALDAAMLRQQAHAANIANAHTLGYQKAGVDFESQLGRARTSLNQGEAIAGADLHGILPVMTFTSNTVQLDMEMAAMAHNSVAHQSLVAGLSRYLSIMASAASDGRR